MGAAASIVSGIGSVVGGFGRAAARRSAARVAEFESAQTLIRQDQNTARRMQELNQTLASIEAISAGAGFSQDSPTARAIRASRRRSAREALIQENLGFALQRTSRRSEAVRQREAAPFEVLGGAAQGFGAFADAASRLRLFGSGS